MPANEWYKHWFNSPYYHKLYFDRDESEAKNFIQHLINYLEPAPASRVADIACGRGRHSKILADYGFDVAGFDLSADNIAYANRFAHEHLQFYVHDMRLPFWINYFDLAFNFFTSFGYFGTRREHDDAVRSIANSLKPSGYLVFDYLNVHHAEEHLVHNETKTVGETNYDIHRWHDDYFFYKKIAINDPQLSKPIEYTEKVAKLSLGDFTDMLSFQKMQVTDVFGDYLLNKYDIYNTPRMIVVAKKL
jgi:SAM-dependent methyltransferase